MRISLLGSIALAALLLSGPISAAEREAFSVEGVVLRMPVFEVAIGGETDPLGWALALGGTDPRQGVSSETVVYLDIPGATDEDYESEAHFRELSRTFAPLEGHTVHVKGTLVRGVLRAGGVETPQRIFDRIDVTAVRRVKGVRIALLYDLTRRGVEFFRDGTSAPTGGLSADGTCEDGTAATRVFLEVPPPGGADFFTDTAFVCETQALYWAHRQGGFPGANLWVGPFDLPGDARQEPTVEGPPTRVVPARVRAPRSRPRARRVTVRREATGSVRPRAIDYAPADFDLGEGIEVVRVLRADARRIRLRVRVGPDTEAGMRDVAFKGVTGSARLEIR